jgi:mRNA interferase MazF
MKKMPPTVSYNFGDVNLVPFPFTDQARTKKRPAIVVSSAAYNRVRPDLVLMAVTSQVRSVLAFGEVNITHWSAAGLLKPSIIKPVFTTIEKILVLRGLGHLEPTDEQSLRGTLPTILG